MAVTATAVLDTHKPLDSVGLVCTCGKAVATIEGVAVKCPSCGKTYIISVMVLSGSYS